jgi:hypothetical protein
MTGIKEFFIGLWRTDRGLTATGFAMLGILAFTGIGLLVDPRIITGAPAWLKPAKFAASISIYVFTLAWLFTCLPEWVRTRRVVGRITVSAMWLEIVLITFQASRGTTSHFNVSTLFNGVIFAAMGMAILLQTLSSVLAAAAAWRQRFEDPAMGWGFRLGLSIAILGASTGGLMTRPTEAQLEAVAGGGRMTISGAHTVGAPDGGPGIPGTGWSVTHGDLRVPHFFGLHAFQMLPLLALGLRRLRLAERTRVHWVVSSGASYAGLFAILLAQALQGKPFVHPDESTVEALALWAAASVALILIAWLRGGARKGYVTS